MAATGNKSYQWQNATQGKQGNIAKAGSAEETADLATASTVFPLGVLSNQPKVNETAQFQNPVDGDVVQVLVDGSGTAIAFGDPIKCNGSGVGVKAAKAGTFTAAANWIIGYALEATSEANVLISVQWSREEWNL